MTVLSAGDLGVEIDYGIGNPPGTLQRFDKGKWLDYSREGETITSESLDIENLCDCFYKLVQLHCRLSG